MFINFTNHPSARWEKKQVEAAHQFGTIRDLEFPKVDPHADKSEIVKMAESYVDKILELNPKAVLCQGEFCLAYQVIRKLQEKGVLVLAACSERKVKEEGNKKEVVFVFEQFREY